MIKLPKGKCVKASVSSTQAFPGTRKAVGVNVTKDQPVSIPGPARFQNLIQYCGRHDRETE